MIEPMVNGEALTSITLAAPCIPLKTRLYKSLQGTEHAKLRSKRSCPLKRREFSTIHCEFNYEYVLRMYVL